MQKKIIALAVAGLVSGGAFAQSNVTISGQFKVGMDSISANGATANAAGVSSNYTSRTRVVDNNSNIRFSGSEKLGNGMTAVFQVESALGTDNYDGTASGNIASTPATRNATLGSRDTFVGLSGNWGTVALGKHSVHYNSMANVEAAGLADGLALVTSSLNLLNTINGTTLGGSTRLTNAIAYISPTWNGFNALVGYTTLGEMTTVNQAKKDNGLNVKLAYNNGPIAATYSYLAVNGAGATAPTAAAAAVPTSCWDGTSVLFGAAACAAATGTTIAGAAAVAANTGNGFDVRSNRLGAAYTFPMGLKVGLIWDKSKNTNKSGAADTWIERSAWALPISYRTGAHNFSFTYAKTNNTSVDSATGLTAARVAGWDDSAKMTMLGYEYSMSKRTSVAVSWTQINNDSQGTYDFWHPSSNVANGGGALAAASNGADPRAFSVNLFHKF